VCVCVCVYLFRKNLVNFGGEFDDESGKGAPHLIHIYYLFQVGKLEAGSRVSSIKR
jgi:hypothetical protein